MKSKAVILILFIAAVGAIVYVNRGKRGPTTGAAGGVGGPAPITTPTTQIEFVYGTEKDAWVRAAAEGFHAAHPEVAVKLIPKGSLEAAQAILNGAMKPTVWSPADSLVLNLLGSDWTTKTGGALFAATGDDAPQPVLLTPLVFVVWEDRAGALLKAGKGQLTWAAIRKAVSSTKGWPAVGGKAEWGFIKLGHTDPTRSNSGLQALYLMSLEFYNRAGGLRVEDLLKDDYQAFVRDIERGVTRFEPSTGTFMTDMVRFGPSKYDIAVVYEALAIAQLENAQSRWGNLRVYYPRLTLWSDNPVAILTGDWVSAPEREAARTFVNYLRSKPVQERALAFGFRPADPGVPIQTADPQNPFGRLARYGLHAEVPPVAQPPDGAVVRNLLTLWSRLQQAR
jgi:hypothetical protein